MTPPKETSETTAIHMLLEKMLIGEIEDFRFRHRFQTRVETIKALLRIGLQHGDVDLTKAKKAASTSSKPKTALKARRKD